MVDDAKAMPVGDVIISRGAYRALLSDVQRASEICAEISTLKFTLRRLMARVSDDAARVESLGKAVEACENATRMRVELAALERRIRELDHELTPLRPPSRTDIKAAFDASVEFAQGKKKPPEKDG